jgi:hypothetical protein
MAFAPDVRHELTPEDARKGALRAAEVRRRKREQAAAKMEAALAAEAEEDRCRPPGRGPPEPTGSRQPRTSHPRSLHGPRRPPPTVVSHEQDPDRPIRIVVESISSRRREQLADVEAEDAEVEELPAV